MAEKNEFEPGAAHFGNFINYYEFNPPSNRLELFDDNFCDHAENSLSSTSITCLDIGCNTGVSSIYAQFSLYNEIIVASNDTSIFSLYIYKYWLENCEESSVVSL